MKQLVPIELIERKIYSIRGQNVMLDRDLAQLYGVETRALNQAVRRNKDRFPHDFMFVLTREEIQSISQIVISSAGRKDTLKFSKNVLVFTEQGVAMLSSILNSKRAVQVNVAIMRTFVKLRKMMATHKDLARKLEELEKKYDGQFQVVFEAIRQLIEVEEKPKRKIGFIAKEQHAIPRLSIPQLPLGWKALPRDHKNKPSRVSSSGRSRCSWEPPAPAVGGSTL